MMFRTPAACADRIPDNASSNTMHRSSASLSFCAAKIYTSGAGLPGYCPSYDEDGTIIHWACDQDEIDAIEDAERANGLYVPTAENLQPFHDALSNLPDAA
jgi:hypothetical protein